MLLSLLSLALSIRRQIFQGVALQMHGEKKSPPFPNEGTDIIGGGAPGRPNLEDGTVGGPEGERAGALEALSLSVGGSRVGGLMMR